MTIYDFIECIHKMKFFIESLHSNAKLAIEVDRISKRRIEYELLSFSHYQIAPGQWQGMKYNYMLGSKFSTIEEHENLKNEIEQIKEEIEWRKEAFDKLDDVNIKLNDKLKIATEALEFYSKESSYYVNGTWDIQNHIDDSDLEQKIIYQDLISVGGKRAREAFEKLKKEIEA